MLNALLALGYSEKEAALAQSSSVPAGTGVSDGIKLALKALVEGLKGLGEGVLRGLASQRAKPAYPT